MRIRSDEIIAGFPANQLRELLRQNDQYLSVIHVDKVFGLRGKKALKLLETLEQQGFITKNFADSNATQYWSLTLRGSALRIALFSAPVSPRNAEKKLCEFMEHVHQVNDDVQFLYRVRKVIVFGSFLTGSPIVGDLDISIDLEPKEPNAKKHADLTLARANMAARNSKRFQSFVDRLFFADLEVRSFLKARSRIIQLTDCSDGVLKIAEHSVFYEYH